MAAAARTEDKPDTADTDQQLGRLIPLPARATREVPLTSEPPLADLAPLTSEQPLGVQPPLTAEPHGRGGAGAAEV